MAYSGADAPPGGGQPDTSKEECSDSPMPRETSETASLWAASSPWPAELPSTPVKQDGGMDLLPLRVSSPTMTPSEFSLSPSTSTSSSCGAGSPSQEPIKIQPAAELTTGFGLNSSKEIDEKSPSVLNLSTALAEPRIILKLDYAIQEPDLGSEDLPTIGSVGHKSGTCKPCAFLHTKGCENGASCPFCHLCKPGEKKRRLKEKKEQKIQVTRFMALQEQINQEWQMYIPPPR